MHSQALHFDGICKACTGGMAVISFALKLDWVAMERAYPRILSLASLSFVCLMGCDGMLEELT